MFHLFFAQCGEATFKVWGFFLAASQGYSFFLLILLLLLLFMYFFFLQMIFSMWDFSTSMIHFLNVFSSLTSAQEATTQLSVLGGLLVRIAI